MPRRQVPKDSAEPEDKVGYGHPPKKHRFKKGKSGNPKGRPKGTRNILTDLREVFAMPLYIETERGRRKVSTQFGLLLRLRSMALKDNLRALTHAIELSLQYLVEEDSKAEGSQTDAEEQAILDAFVQVRLDELAAAKRAGVGAKKDKGAEAEEGSTEPKSEVAPPANDASGKR